MVLDIGGLWDCLGVVAARHQHGRGCIASRLRSAIDRAIGQRCRGQQQN